MAQTLEIAGSTPSFLPPAVVDALAKTAWRLVRDEAEVEAWIEEAWDAAAVVEAELGHEPPVSLEEYSRASSSGSP